MSWRGFPLLVLLTLAAGCSGDPRGALAEPSTGPRQASEVTFQAVDAGTGDALTDPRMTVRYIVRSPITLDAVGRDTVSSAEPYRISHEVEVDSLVLEVRLEAPSYHRRDTILAVARGTAVGPLTVPMSRRLTARDGSEGRPEPETGSRNTREPAVENRPAAGSNESALRAGDRAFARGRWFEAAAAYQRMPVPTRAGAYARAYQQGMVNRGVAHIRLNELGAALEALEVAVAMETPNPQVYRYLGHVLCAVGRVDDGLDALDEIEDMADEIPAAQRPLALAFGKYEEGLCRKRSFDRTEVTLNLVSAGRSVIAALDDFVDRAGDVEQPPRELTQAVEHAEGLLEEVRSRMRRGGL
jgi:hypothetical protein